MFYSEHTALLLKKLPFTLLFYNAICYENFDSAPLQSLITNALDDIKTRELSHVISFIFEYLANIIIHDHLSPLNFCLSILRHVVVLIGKIQDIKIKASLSAAVFDHPVLKELHSRVITEILHLQNVNDFPSQLNTQVS